MATYVIQKQDMAQGEERLTEEVIVPPGLTDVRIEIDLNANEMRDPTTHVRAQIEWWDTRDVPFWRVINVCELIGHPSNQIQQIPYIRLSEDDLTFFAGETLRGRLVALSAGRYGATVRAD